MDINLEYEYYHDDDDGLREYEDEESISGLESLYYPDVYERFDKDEQEYDGDDEIDENEEEEEEEEEEEDGDNEIDYFNGLNEDCLTYIFSQITSFAHLSSMRRVCQRWKHIIDDELARKKKLSIINVYAHETLGVPLNLNDNSMNQLNLSVVVMDSNVDLLLNFLKNYCSQIESMDLVFITIDDAISTILVKNFQNVIHLNLWHSFGINEDIISKLIGQFGEQLESLIVKDCDISEESLMMIVANTPNLHSLNISGNNEILFEPSFCVPTKLKLLHASRCNHLGNEALGYIISSCGDTLEDLKISGSVVDEMFSLISLTKNLKSLHCIYGCTRQPGSSIDFLSCIGQLNQLERLTLHESDALYGSLDDRGLKSIMKGCSKLKTLDIHLGNGEDILITDSSMVHIAELLPQIEILNIINAEGLTNRSLFAISRLRNLKVLDLTNFFAIDDQGVIEITKHCNQLRKLCICQCKGITNATLNATIQMALVRPKHRIEVVFFETSIEVPNDLNFVIPSNMFIRISWYKQTQNGRHYTEVSLPKSQ